MEKATVEKRTHRRGHGRLLVLALGLCALTAGAVWAGHKAMSSTGWHGPMAWSHRHAGIMHDFIEFKIDRALRKVGASETQRGQVEAILERTFAELRPKQSARRVFHDRIASVITADRIDRDALEALRVEHLEHADEVSRRLVDAIADIAEILTPEQRRALVELHRAQVE
jgi:protein CpxP